MRKITSLVAILLFLTIFLSGCNNGSSPVVPTEAPAKPVPVRRYFKQYGFSFVIAGDAVEVGSNTVDYPTIKTDIGYLQFIKEEITESTEVKNARQLADNLARQMNGTVQILENDVPFVVYGPVDAEYNQKHMVSYYLHQQGEAIWVIICTNTAEDFDQTAIIDVCMSAEFYK